MKLLIIVFGLLATSAVGQSCGVSSACCKKLEGKLDALTEVVKNVKDPMQSQNIAAGAETTAAALTTTSAALTTTSAALTTTSAALTTVDPLIKECSDLHGMIHESTCYFPLEGRYEFDDSLLECEKVAGATLASVTTNELYGALVPFLREIVVAEGGNSIGWGVALKYDPNIGGQDMTTLDGTTVTVNDWFPYYPKTTADWSDYQSYEGVTFVVYAVEKSGFVNGQLNRRRRPLCMI